MKKLLLIAFSILAVQSSFAYDLKIDVLRVTKGEEIDEVRVNEGINQSVNRNALDIIVNCSTTSKLTKFVPPILDMVKSKYSISGSLMGVGRSKKHYAN